MFSKKLKIFIVIILSLIILPNISSSQTSPDAIAIKIIPNPQHLSPQAWYKQQGFTGSPQSATVDGYQAIRDGRTVYVNVANITGTAPSATLYTNIYLISYNQEAETATQDIFGQILNHWKFNTNITDTGKCVSPPSTSPASDAKTCVLDQDCPINEYCNSDQAKIRRDVLRLSELAEINQALENYNKQNSSYPKLTAGTYIPATTLSTWPSWQQFLSQDLRLPAIKDPINKLGDCAGYDPTTCWDEKNKKFADPTPTNSQLDLPPNSKVFAYESRGNGDDYYLCANMETHNYATIDQSNCSQNFITNNIPIVSCGYLEGAPGAVFNGYVQATDPDGHRITKWDITADPLTPCTGWTEGPVLQAVPGQENQRKVYAASAQTTVGECKINVTATDEFGLSSVSTECAIKIWAQPPQVNTAGCHTIAKINKEFSCAITATDLNGLPITGIDISGAPSWLTVDPLPTGGNSRKLYGTPTTAGSYTLSATARTAYGTSEPRQFTIKTVTWCGDNTLQALNGEGLTEQCEPPNSDTFTNPPTNNAYLTPQESKSDRQYHCNASCQYDLGWCGDNIVSKVYSKATGLLERCDPPGKGGKGTSATDQWGCSNDCQWADGWCGNGHRDEPYELCDNGVNNGTVCSPSRTSCTWCDKYCRTHTEASSNFCGNKIIETTFGEECELPTDGSGSGPENPYSCIDCKSGGWYGNDDRIDDPYEECDDGNEYKYDTCDHGILRETINCSVNRSPKVVKLSLTDIIQPISGTYDNQITSCGETCMNLAFGRVEDNYWYGNCSTYEQNQLFEIKRPDKINSAILTEALWDDYIHVYINNNEIYTNPAWDGNCERSTNWHTYPNLDITNYFKNYGPLNVKVEVVVTGGGEGYTHSIITLGNLCETQSDVNTDPITNNCQEKEVNSSCVLVRETIDGVTTVNEAVITGNEPLPSNRLVFANLLQCPTTLNRPWWNKSRIYSCKVNP